MASTRAISTGMYSGRQPAITPFTATDHMVAARLSGNRIAKTSSGSRSVKARKASTRSAVGGMIGNPSLHSFSTNRRLISSMVPEKTISCGSGSSTVAISPGASVRLRTTSSTVTPRTFSLSSSVLCVPTWPGTKATGRFGSPSPTLVVPACPMKPSQTREEEGTPAFSAAALARNTAGVQLPQQPMPEMTASTPIDFIVSGRSARICRSSAPWVEPKSFQLTNLTVG